MIAKLSDEEAACIGSELGGERYQWVLERSAVQGIVPGLIDGGPWAEIWQVLLWGCLTQATATDLLWADTEQHKEGIVDSTRQGMFGKGEGEFVITEECVRELVSYVDFSRFLTAGLPGVSEESRSREDYERGASVFLLEIYLCAEPVDGYGEDSQFSDRFGFTSDSEIRWSVVVGQVTAAESACIGEQGQKSNGSALQRQVFDSVAEAWAVSAWGCLSQGKRGPPVRDEQPATALHRQRLRNAGI